MTPELCGQLALNTVPFALGRGRGFRVNIKIRQQIEGCKLWDLVTPGSHVSSVLGVVAALARAIYNHGHIDRPDFGEVPPGVERV
jgi:hypothetical protein